MSRYQPPLRDRSPPRFSDRRPSVPYNNPPGSAPSRATSDSGQTANDRGPPRGPKADSQRGGYPHTTLTRGRGGFAARADSWERESDRDQRSGRPPLSNYRRDDDRPDWPRRERDLSGPDRNISLTRDARSYVGRDRSASPARQRRDSKENLHPIYARPLEGSSYAPSGRGGPFRGRGRDWERSRDRGLFGGDRERDLFARSRSREAWRDRDREREPETTWPDRRGRERSRELESRPREYDSWPRDRPSSRQSDGMVQAQATPTTGTSAAFSDVPTAQGDRVAVSGKHESARKPSFTAADVAPAQTKDLRKDLDHPTSTSRLEASSREVRRYSPSSVTPTQNAASLEYGPPPSSITSEKPPAPKAVTQKAEPLPTGLQPPTGPKADRNTAQVVAAKSIPQEAWNLDGRTRSSYPQPPTNTTQVQPDASKTMETAPYNRSPAVSTTEKQLPPGVPSGPRSAATSSKPRITSKDQGLPPTVPNAPKGNLKPALSEQRSSIPTGPRSWAGNKPGPPSGPSRPSIMGSMNKPQHDRATLAAAGSRLEPGMRQPPSRPRMFQPSIMNRPNEAAFKDEAKKPSIFGPAGSAGLNRTLEGIKDREMEDDSMNASSDDDVEDEDALDEEDFRDSEEKHDREIRSLELKRPPPLLKDPAIVGLLIRVQLLSMIAEDSVPPFAKNQPVLEDVSMADVVPTGLLSPQGISDEETKPTTKPTPLGRPLRESPINPIPTPPIEDLPYLKDGISNREVTFEDSDDEVEREAMAMLVQQDLERKAWEWRDEIDILRNAYRNDYLQWRQTVQELDQRKDLRIYTPAPASPAPSASAALAPLVQERTRGARNATDADLEAVLRLSEQSAREEQERRERETAEPNYDSEAVLPPMLEPAELEIRRFKDINKLVPMELSVDMFELIPPVDDFTPEEQSAFIAAYNQYPKKFGKIADKIAGRTYQQCIMHYYLTKDEAKYKENFRRVAPKRGRRKFQTQASASALLTEGIYHDETEITPMTDSGRPRRAAAPTFGDNGTDQESVIASQLNRRAAAGPKEVNGEMVKATRGRKAGTGTRTRRTKAQIAEDQRLAQAQVLNALDSSPQKIGRPGRSEKSASLLHGPPNPRSDQSLNGDMPRVVDNEGAAMQHPTIDYPLPQHLLVPTVPAAPQIGSYWSVPEQQKFPELIAHFGRDFPAIADFMKTKTTVMIKNFYQRQLDQGRRELEQAALIAEEKRSRGENMGSAPAPIAPIKRRYESTPSLAAPSRSIVASMDNPAIAVDAHSLKAGHAQVDEQDPRPIQRVKPEPNPVSREGFNGQPASLPRRFEDQTHLDRPIHSSQRPPIQSSMFAHERAEMRLSHLVPTTSDQHLLHHPTTRAIEPHHDEVLQGRLSHPGYGRDATVQDSHAPVVPTLHSAHGHHTQNLLGHSRSNSAISGPQSIPLAVDRTPETAFSRHEPLHRSIAQGPAAQMSPIVSQQQGIPTYRIDMHRTSSNPAGLATEPPKPAPVKRSNIMDMLNEEPSDSQLTKAVSRSMIASSPPSTRQNYFVPPKANVADDSGLFSRPRPTFEAQQQPQTHQSITPSSQQSAFDSPGPPHIAREQSWLNRFDPRQPPTTSGRQSPMSIPAAQSHYSVAPPPSSQPGSLSQRPPLQTLSARVDTGRNVALDHGHRAFLGQLNYPTLAPSPPPQQSLQPQTQSQAGPAQTYRSASGSSHHNRTGSIGYGLTPQQAHPSVPQVHGHSHSASSTPVSALHAQSHRSHGSMGYESRLSLGGQPLQSQSSQSLFDQDRERERQRREQEIPQQVLREQQAAARRDARRRDIPEQLDRERFRGNEAANFSSLSRSPYTTATHDLGRSNIFDTERSFREKEILDREVQRQRLSSASGGPQSATGSGPSGSGLPITVLPRRSDTLGGFPTDQHQRERESIPTSRTFTPPGAHSHHSSHTAPSSAQPPTASTPGFGSYFGLGGLFGPMRETARDRERDREVREREREREHASSSSAAAAASHPMRSLSQSSANLGGHGPGAAAGDEKR